MHSMKIAYCTNVRLPSERAHGHQIAQVCDALVRLGNDVTIFAPYRRNPVKVDFWTYYNADRRVDIRYLGNFDPIHYFVLTRMLGLLWLNFSLKREYKRVLKKDEFDLLYTRSPALLQTFIRSGVPTVIELHSLPRRGRNAFVAACNQCELVVCLTSAMKQKLQEWGVRSELLIVGGDGVDLRRFQKLPTREEARQQFGIRTSRLVVGYVGRLKTLFMDKGVADLLKALKLLQSEQLALGFIVGGPKEDKEEYEAMARNLGLTTEDVLFSGAIEAARVPASMAACDILAMPWPDKPHYRHEMSPLKMFEYMAAERPIITGDLPTVRDVLNEEMAVFSVPDSPASIAEAIRLIQKEPDRAQALVKKARAAVENYSWERRMERILRYATA